MDKVIDPSKCSICGEPNQCARRLPKPLEGCPRPAGAWLQPSHQNFLLECLQRFKTRPVFEFLPFRFWQSYLSTELGECQAGGTIGCRLFASKPLNLFSRGVWCLACALELRLSRVIFFIRATPIRYLEKFGYRIKWNPSQTCQPLRSRFERLIRKLAFMWVGSITNVGKGAFPLPPYVAVFGTKLKLEK